MYLYLIRHGETWANAEQRYLGSLDPGLIELGRQQAEALSRDNGVFPRTGCRGFWGFDSSWGKSVG